MSTLRVNTLQNTSTTDGGISINASGHVTVDGVAMPSAGPLSNRNKIINGDMRIDQRNAGSATTSTYTGYTVDRWQVLQSPTGKLVAQQNAGSVTPPASFTNYLGVTSQSAYTLGTADYFTINQYIEGYNFADLLFGTANAKPITISFWVRSSLTGTFGGALRSGGADRSYPFTYTIDSANTWEQKSVSIAGDTSGTWNTTNGIAIGVFFGIGAGSTYNGTAGSWQSANYLSATGGTSVVGTNGATFYITGVQLEPGTVATPFEHRSYGDELARCQRYYAKTYSQQTVPGTATDVGAITSSSQAVSTYASAGTWQFPVTMRQAPTIILYSTQNANTVGKVTADTTDGTGQAIFISDRSAFINRSNDSSGVNTNVYMKAQATASAEF